VAKRTRGWYEQFACFFENPSREGLRDLLRDQVGELDVCDFKREWPDFPSLARHILGLANSGGGCLVIGVEERPDGTFDPVGVDEFRDKADVHKGIQKFIPSQLRCEVVDFSYEASEYPRIEGKKFQVVFVDDCPEYVPFIARANGQGIRENAIYVRRGTSTEEANYEELQEIINRRLRTGYCTKEFSLDRHLAELRILYKYYDPFGDLFPLRPRGRFANFVGSLIGQKEAVIQSLVLSRR